MAHLLDGRDGFHLQLGNPSWLFQELDVPCYSAAYMCTVYYISIYLNIYIYVIYYIHIIPVISYTYIHLLS